MLLASILSVAAIAGCDNRPETIAPATGTPAEIFRAEQADTRLPGVDGEVGIDLATVEDTREGRVRYRTTDGMLFEVEMETAADGTHRWTNAREIVEPD